MTKARSKKLQAKVISAHVDTVLNNRVLATKVYEALSQCGVNVVQVQVQRIETPKRKPAKQAR